MRGERGEARERQSGAVKWKIKRLLAKICEKSYNSCCHVNENCRKLRMTRSTDYVWARLIEYRQFEDSCI